MISQEEAKELFEYLDGKLLWRVRPIRSHVKIGDVAGTVCRAIGKKKHHGTYHKIQVRGKIYFRSNITWVYHYGDIPEEMQVDHWDRNSLNDHIENLRLGTKSQNDQNRRIATRNKSGFKGVSPCPWAPGKWRAAIGVNKKILRLGIFDTPEDAARAYDKAAREHFGEFACVNFP